MKRVLVISTAALISGSAGAADLYGSMKDAPAPVVAAPVWSGFYIGAHGGYGQSVSGQDSAITATETETLSYTGEQPYSITGKAVTTGIATGADQSGFLYGAQIGYWGQLGSNVAIGVEASFSGSSIAGDKANVSKTSTIFSASDSLGNSMTSDPYPGHISTEAHSQLDWITAVTGQIGLPLGVVMPYVKGGFAAGETRDSLSIGDGSVVLNRSGVQTGWTAGGGILWAVSQNWRLFWDFDYYNLGSRSMSYADSTSYKPADGYRIDTTLDIRKTSVDSDFWATKFGVNYQINSVYTPLK